MIQARCLLQDLLWTQTTNFLLHKKFLPGPVWGYYAIKPAFIILLDGKARFLELSSKSASEEKEANKTSKKEAKMMTGRMQEDKSQSGFTFSHGQEEEEKTLSQLAILHKDTVVN